MTFSLLLKVIVTPALIAAATLAGRRWGDRLSGWLVGLPLTSGPVVFFLAIDQGSGFATKAAFAVAYARAAVRSAWAVATLAGFTTFAIATIAFQRVSVSALPAFALVTASLILATLLMPKSRPADDRTRAPHWDLPLRIVVATGLVLLLTGIAPTIGAHLTGLLSPFPVYAGVLAIFAHRQSGGDAANNVLRGLLLGLFAFGAFFLLLAIGLSRLGVGLAFLVATVTGLTIQGLTLRAAWSTGDRTLP